MLVVLKASFGVARAQVPPSPSANAEARLASAHTALDRGQWAAAEQDLRVYLNNQPHSAEALYLLGLTLCREDQPASSLEVFTQAAQQRRPTGEELRYVALDYVLLKDFGDAEKWISRSVQENPRDGESWYALGRIQYTQNEFTAAIKSFERALELMPLSVKTEDSLGLAYEGLNQPDQAIAAYRQAIAWQGKTPRPSEQPLINLGILLADRNHFDEALALLRQAEGIAPKDERVHGALGKLYARQGNLSGAQAELEQAITAKPEDSGLHFQLGQVYRREGMADRASAELARSAALERQGRH